MTQQSNILCPGQGAQAVGMGRAWFDASSMARDVFAEADALLEPLLGAKISSLCFDGPAERLNRTDVSQPAIYVTSVASYRAVCELEAMEPAATAGLSLGEYTALHLAGVFSFADGLRLVAHRGRAMQEAAERSRGSMVALTGADEQQALEVCRLASEGGVLVAANYNAPGQIVLSGDQAACERAVEAAADAGVRATPLVVAGAFHSPLMAPAARHLAGALEGVEIRPPSCPVVSNVTGWPHEADPASIRRRLVEQITMPVRWKECCEWLLNCARGRYDELAPGKVLSGLMRRISREAKVVNHDQPR